MSIFAVDAEQNILDRPSLTNKAQKFRLEIRRRQNDQRFKTIRKQFVQSLKSLSFLEELKSQKDNLTAKKINWLIEGLEGGQNNASFYQDMMDMQLEPYLCQVMLNQQISLENKTKILKSLVQLTYFSCKMPKQFLQNSVIDYFRVQLKKVQLGDEIQQQFVDYLSKLILNLTSFKDIQFNEHMMESDFLPLFRDLLDNRNANRQFNSSLRQTLLKIYSNIYRSNPQSMKSIVETLYRILSDQQNSDNQTRLCCTLKCLVQAAKIPNFWLYLQQRTTENGQIYKQILSLVDIIQTNFTETNFGLLVDFLNALYDQNQRLVTEQTNNYYQQFPKDFFLNAFDMLKKTQQNNQQSRRIICKLVKLLARLPSLQNIAYRTNLQRADMISGIMEKSIVSNSISRKYLARVLSKALEEDSCVIDVLIDNGIIDLLRDLIDSQFFKEQKVDVINLVEKLIQAEQVMRDKTRQQNKMLNVLYDRGIIRDIEKLQDDKNENVYRRAEQFMGRLNEFSQKN